MILFLMFSSRSGEITPAPTNTHLQISKFPDQQTTMKIICKWKLKLHGPKINPIILSRVELPSTYKMNLLSLNCAIQTNSLLFKCQKWHKCQQKKKSSADDDWRNMFKSNIREHCAIGSLCDVCASVFERWKVQVMMTSAKCSNRTLDSGLFMSVRAVSIFRFPIQSKVQCCVCVECSNRIRRAISFLFL